MTALHADPPISCERAREQLSGLIDGELDATGERRVRDHLNACPACEAVHGELLALSGALRSEGRALPPPPSWERLSTTIGASRVLEAAHGPNRPGHIPRPATIVAAALAIAATAAFAFFVDSALRGGEWALRGHRQNGSPTRLASIGLPTELFSQLVDPGRDPDFTAIGSSLALDRGGLSDLPRRAAFDPVMLDTLPGGYRLEKGSVVQLGSCRLVYLRYRRGEQVIAILQEPSGTVQICPLTGAQCCMVGGMLCRRRQIDRVEVVQTTRDGLAFTVAVSKGTADVDALLASLDRPATTLVN